MRRELQQVAPHAFRQPPKGAPRMRRAKAAARPVRAAPKAKVANGAPVDVDDGGWKEFWKSLAKAVRKALRAP